MSWIYIEEKEPDEEMHVLLFDVTEGICVGFKSHLGHYCHHPMGDFASGNGLFGVTHWKFLPIEPEGVRMKK